MNYLQFVDAIQQYAENYEQTFVDNLPVFLRVTEKRIYNHVQPPSAKKYTTGTLLASSNVIQKPDDYLSSDYLRIYNPSNEATVAFLVHKDQSFLREAFMAATPGVPYAYADTDESTFTLAPTAAMTYGYELGYFGYPESIVDTNDGNSWLGTNYEQALLYGALREAAIFMKETEDVVKMYDSLYQQGLADVRILGAVKNQGDVYRRGGRK